MSMDKYITIALFVILSTNIVFGQTRGSERHIDDPKDIENSVGSNQPFSATIPNPFSATVHSTTMDLPRGAEVSYQDDVFTASTVGSSTSSTGITMSGIRNLRVPKKGQVTGEQVSGLENKGVIAKDLGTVTLTSTGFEAEHVRDFTTGSSTFRESSGLVVSGTKTLVKNTERMTIIEGSKVVVAGENLLFL